MRSLGRERAEGCNSPSGGDEKWRKESQRCHVRLNGYSLDNKWDEDIA